MHAADTIDLEEVKVLLVDDNAQALDILGSVMSGFGARTLIRCTSAKEAKEVMRKQTVDFVLSDVNMPDEDGYQLVEWIRHEAQPPNRFVPILLVTGHTPQSAVHRARDCGANFVISKPITPAVLLERLFWVASEERMFVDCEAYVGPDRRFKFEGPPIGEEGRRKDDLPAEVGAAIDPNLSQDEVNSLFSPAKVAL